GRPARAARRLAGQPATPAAAGGQDGLRVACRQQTGKSRGTGAQRLRRWTRQPRRARRKPRSAPALCRLRQPGGNGPGASAVAAPLRPAGEGSLAGSGGVAMSATQSLALNLPLRGSQLIEASAGTGKTFTISALYVRLVLGHGGAERGFGRPLLPPEILVVTFTDAATQELRERIRARLAEAARHFRGELATPDALLDELRGEYAEADWPVCARRLDVAAQWMDEAAVSTIHSWCQRMLREHAFDSGSLFTQTLETDQSDLLAEVVRDYWREHFYPLDGAALQWVHERWQSPQHLLGRLRPLLGQSLGEPGADPETLIEQTLQERARKLAELKAPWGAWAEELRTLLDGACARKEVNGRRLQARWYNPWCDLLRDWAADVSAMDLALGTGFTRLTPDGLA